MEEYAYEKIEEKPKMESEEEEVKRVVVNFVEEEETNPEISSSKDIDVVVVENSVEESYNTNLEEEVEESKDAPLESSGVCDEDGENKNELSETPSVDESDSVVEVSIENSEDSQAQVEEKVVLLNETNGIASDVKDANGDEETPFVPQSLEESKSQVEADETKVDVVAKEIEETNLPSLTDEMSMETDEKPQQSFDENVALSSVSADVRSRGIEDENLLPPNDKTEETSPSVDKGTVANVEDSSKPVANDAGIQSNDCFPESVGNTPIISLRQRTVQRTSWRSCCGLFEVLRRADT